MSLVDIVAVNQFLDFTMEKFEYPVSAGAGAGAGAARSRNERNAGVTSIPVDILETPKEYVFHFDIPGLSKTDVQVTVEEEDTLVIRSNGKRKREDGEEEGCKYLRVERKAAQKVERRFKLPENANREAITAKCEDGVLTVTVQKLPPQPKHKTIQVNAA